MANTRPSATSSPAETAQLSGLILAGGAGRRMGGADKGLVELDGRPLIAAAIERIAPQVSEVLISANRNHDRYLRFGHAVISDRFIDPAEPYPGPLAGLHAGLAQARHEWLLCVPCDAPRLPRDLAARLQAALAAIPAATPAARLAVARCAGRLQPTFCLLHRALLPALEQALHDGMRKVSAWQQSHGATLVDFPDVDAFANLNTMPAPC